MNIGFYYSTVHIESMKHHVDVHFFGREKSDFYARLSNHGLPAVLTSWSKVLLEKFIVSHIVKDSAAFAEPESSL
jgi:hypothetical protein